MMELLSQHSWGVDLWGAWRGTRTGVGSCVPIVDPSPAPVAVLLSPSPEEGGYFGNIVEGLCVVGPWRAGGIAGCSVGGDWDRDRVVMGGTALGLAAVALMWFVGRAPRQTSCSQLRQAPACPCAWIRPCFQPL